MELATKVMDLKDELKNTNVTLKINAIRNNVFEQIQDNKELADSFLKNGEHAQKQMQIQYNDILDELDIKKVEVK